MSSSRAKGLNPVVRWSVEIIFTLPRFYIREKKLPVPTRQENGWKPKGDRLMKRKISAPVRNRNPVNATIDMMKLQHMVCLFVTLRAISASM